MGLSIQKFDPKTPMIIPQQKLWLTADKSRLVPDGHPDAAFLFCMPGRPILRSEAAKWGLLETPTPEPETKPADGETNRPEPETKVILPETTQTRKKKG